MIVQLHRMFPLKQRSVRVLQLGNSSTGGWIRESSLQMSERACVQHARLSTDETLSGVVWSTPPKVLPSMRLPKATMTHCTPFWFLEAPFLYNITSYSAVNQPSLCSSTGVSTGSEQCVVGAGSFVRCVQDSRSVPKPFNTGYYVSTCWQSSHDFKPKMWNPHKWRNQMN